MKLVAYIQTEIGRRYFQQAGSYGLTVDYTLDTLPNSDNFEGTCGLGSRVLEFDSHKQVLAFLSGMSPSMDPRMTMAEVGYHGLTENGNACAPFATFNKPMVEKEFAEIWTRGHLQERKYRKALYLLELPPIFEISNVYVGRDKELDIHDVLGFLQHHLVNQVTEDEESIRTALHNMTQAGWTFTDVDTSGYTAFVHASRKKYPTESEIRSDREGYRHVAVMINCLNLMEPEDIQQLKGAE